MTKEVIIPMTQQVIIPLTNTKTSQPVESGKLNEKHLTLWLAGVQIGFIGGILSLVIGLTLTVIFWFAGKDIPSSVIGQIGIWLIAAAYLLIGLGAHSFDKVEQITRAEKTGFCR
jgi:uncharacterized membrane protein